MTVDYSKKYKVKKATSISDTSVLYGDTDTASMWIVGVTAVVTTAIVFVTVVRVYSDLTIL